MTGHLKQSVLRWLSALSLGASQRVDQAGIAGVAGICGDCGPVLDNPVGFLGAFQSHGTVHLLKHWASLFVFCPAYADFKPHYPCPNSCQSRNQCQCDATFMLVRSRPNVLGALAFRTWRTATQTRRAG